MGQQDRVGFPPQYRSLSFGRWEIDTKRDISSGASLELVITRFRLRAKRRISSSSSTNDHAISNLHYRRFQKCIKGAQIKRVRIYRFRLWGWLNQETLFFLVMVVEMRPTHPPRRQRMHNFCVEDRIDYIAVCGDGFLSSLLELLYSLDRLVRRRA